MAPQSRGTSLLASVATAKERLDQAVLRGKRALGLLRPVQARPYLGHGTPVVVHVKGRVQEETGVQPPRPGDSPWDNLVATVRRFTATPVPDARVLARLGETATEVRSDVDGWFRTTLHLRSPLAAGWHDVSATLLQPGGLPAEPAASRVLVPPPDAAFGIISDLDDTVIRSEVTNPLRAVATVLWHNATTRTPFEGVAAFYRALQAGPSGTGRNPLFYVSSSPWNLYDMVSMFLQVQGIPEGPLFLRAWGLDADALPHGGHSGHKSELVFGLLETYPDLPFVLIGDSGQEDPEIYRDVVLARPGRILAVYIRDVTTEERDAEVRLVAQQVRDAGVPFELVADTAGAALHAAELGLLTRRAITDVVTAVQGR